MKIQPVDTDSDGTIQIEIQAKPTPVVKSRLKRLFERQFHWISLSEKLAGVVCDFKDKDRDVAAAAAAAGGGGSGGGNNDALEPSSVMLDNMVRNFIEGSNDRSSLSKCNRSHYHRGNCFQGSYEDSSDDDLEFSSTIGDSSMISAGDSGDELKGLVVCASVTERNLLADATAIMEKLKNTKSRKETRDILTVRLQSLGYDAAICKSRWEKSPSYPAGEHDYIDVIVDHDHRVLIDIDFRSEFEIARSTKSYRALLQSLPLIFVGTDDRASKIVAVVSEAAKQSLKKKGLHIPPWRKTEYMSAKWLAQYKREETRGEIVDVSLDEEEAEVTTWQMPAVREKVGQNGTKVVTGLASVLHEKA